MTEMQYTKTAEMTEHISIYVFETYAKSCFRFKVRNYVTNFKKNCYGL